MIRLQNVCKTFWVKGQPKVVAHDISVTLPGGTGVGLLGRNGAGKSSLLSMLAGTLAPDSGSILRQGSISWPVGYHGSFHGDLTGAQNTRFIARIYGVDSRELSDFAEDFAELGRHYHLPFRTYSSGMRARLSFAVSMGIHFDTYLIDETTAVGDEVFRVKSSRMLMQRLQTSSAIMVSHGMSKLREICSCGAVLEGGRLHWYDDIEDAIAHHQANMKADLDRRAIAPLGALGEGDEG